MSSSKNILLIDVGGTNIDVYEYITSKKACKLINQLNTQNIDINQWVNSLGMKIHDTDYQQIILGMYT